MNLIAQIESVGHSFIEFQEKVIYISKNGDCIISSITGEKFAIINGLFGKLDIYSLSEFYLGHDFESKIVKFQDYQTIDYPFMIIECDELRNLCAYNKEGKRYFASVLKNEEIEWEKQIKKGKFINLFKDKFLNSKYLTDSIFGVYSSSTCEELWIFDTTTLGTWIDYDKTEKTTEVQRVLGELDDKLYIYLNNGKILILDIITGFIIKILKNDTYITSNSWNENFDSNIELDYRNKKLIQLFRTDYTEVDLSTLEIKKISVKNLNNQKLENTNRIAFDTSHIFFSDRNECKVASFNRITMEIDWVYTLSDTNVCEDCGSRYGRDLKLYGNRLFVLDNKHTLHIFEKENA